MLRRLKEDGWKLDRTRGDHRQFVHSAKPGTVTVPGHEGNDLTSGNAKLDMEANGCVLHSGHHKILCPWATRGRYQWWRPEGYLSQAHTQVEANGAEMKYAVVFEKAANNWCAYVPDLPGCVTTGQTPQHTRRMIEEAIEFHIEGLRLRGEPVPEPSAIVDNVEVQAA